MDENYLDSLLNEISLDNEIDNGSTLDNAADGSVRLGEDTFDEMMNRDSNVALSGDDDLFRSSQFDELDELDKMADIDMSDFDFDELDFDDLDVMDTSKKTARPKTRASRTENEPDIDFSDIDIDGAYFSEADKQAIPVANQGYEQAYANGYQEAQPEVTPPKADAQAPEAGPLFTGEPDMQEASEDAQGLNPDAFMESLANSLEENETPATETEADTADTADAGEAETATPDFMENADSEQVENLNLENSDDMSELFEMLGIDDAEPMPASDNGDSLADASLAALKEAGEETVSLSDEDMENLLNDSVNEADGEDAPKKKKRSLADILFGAPEDEEPEPTEEEIAALKAEKAAKKAEKKAEKDAKNEEKKAEKAAKKSASDADKAAKKALKIAKKKEVVDNEPPGPPLNKRAAALIFVFFAILGTIIVFGTKSFNYSLVIQKATDYFERQKYRLAFDEIVGVEVKEKDKDLESRIYTVMYVERLYESYETNVKLHRMDKALDSLLRGLLKYDEHYDEAKELGIVSDIDYSKRRIIAALQSTYQLSESQAYDILALDSYAYREKLNEYATPLGEDEKIILKDNVNEQETTAPQPEPANPDADEPKTEENSGEATTEEGGEAS